MKEQWEIEIDRYIAFKNWLLYGTVFMISVILGIAVYTLIFFFCFWVIRISFCGTYHDSDFYECRYWTKVLVIIGSLCVAALVVVLHLGIIGSILISFIASYSLYKIWLKTKKNFCLNSCTDEQLIEQCKLKGIKQNNYEQIIDHFIKNMEHDKIAKKYYISIRTSEYNRLRWKNKLK